MIRKSQFCKIAGFGVLALAMMAPAGYANVLLPGTSSLTPDNFLAANFGATVADTGIIPVIGMAAGVETYRAQVREIVVLDLTGGCPGCLDFLYQIKRVSGGLGPGALNDAINQVTVTNYAPSTTDVGYCSACTDLIANGGGGYYAPTSESRSGGIGDTVRWNFDIPVTGGIDSLRESYVLVVKTNRTAVVPGSISLIDGGVATVPGLGPVPEPASVGLLLGSLFGAGLFVARRFRVVQS
jgi:hypothetical protein